MRLERVGDDIWIAEGPQIAFYGLKLTTRATLARLACGGLWVHSPVTLDEDLARAVDALGPVRALVAPNLEHHLFLAQWMARYPAAAVHGAPGLAAKRRDIAFDAELGERADPAWAGQIDQALFPGSEAVFFHRASQTAILTDLIINLPDEGQSLLGRLIARADGIAGPEGGVSRLYRLAMCDRAAAQAAARQLLAWRPRRAVFAHGRWYRERATERLAAQFAWLGAAVAAG